MPLWRSLLLNLADRISPEKLPPLQLSSKPVDVGLLFGDRLALPWYRTIFINIADVVSPDLGPPLNLTSRPVDVGQLLGDEVAEGWWRSLMAGLRDRLSPDTPPPLQLTAKPIAAYGAGSWLQVLDWSSLLDTPKVFLPDLPVGSPEASIPAPFAEVPPPEVLALTLEHQELIAIQMQFKRDLSRTRFRQKIWVSVVAAELVVLLTYLFHFH